MQKLLIVDDEKNMQAVLERMLTQDGLHVFTANNGKEAIKLVKKEQPQVVLMDMQMPEMDGMTAFKEIKKLDSKKLIIMMTGFGTTETAIEAMQLGAYDYVTKPFDIPKLKGVVDSALSASTLMEEVVTLTDKNESTKNVDLNVKSIIGMSEPMQNIYKSIGQVANSSVSVLITGESGTGKELISRALYHYSDRSDKPFLAINCAAIPENLLEAELFGYEKGSFTGADERKIGKFELCNGGTIFLDEIGDMPMHTQVKILRVLQEGEFERVGGSETLSTNVRIISATNKNLKEEIKKGNFREDLFYRLNVLQISVPSLRERKEDILDLVKYFLNRFNSEFGKNIVDIPKKYLDKLSSYSWPGNVRELENVIKRSVVTTVGDSLMLAADFHSVKNINEEPTTNNSHSAIFDENISLSELIDNTAETLLEKTLALPDDNPNRESLLEQLEKPLIIKANAKLKGNQVKIAKLLGITRNTLRNRLEKYNS